MIEATARESDRKLPTERELTARFGVSRHAVRQALERLEARGALWRHVGRGTFRGRRSEAEAPAAGTAVHCSPANIHQARRMIEPAIASLAATNASAAQMAEIAAACRRCAAARNMDAYEVFDEAFHRAVATACGNPLVVELFEDVNRARKEIVWGAMGRAVLKPERRAHFSAEHRRIADAIARRDAHEAWHSAVAHMETLAGIYGALRPGEPFIL